MDCNFEADIPTVHFVSFGVSTSAWSVGLQQTVYETVCKVYNGLSTDLAEYTKLHIQALTDLLVVEYIGMVDLMALTIRTFHALNSPGSPSSHSIIGVFR